jgi:LysM repeat protein
MAMNRRPADRLRRSAARSCAGALAAILIVASCGGQDASTSPGTTPASPGSAGVATPDSGTHPGASAGSFVPAVRTPSTSLTPFATAGGPAVPTAPAVPSASPAPPSTPPSSPAPPPARSQPPAPSTMDEYTVVAGDTLWDIAARHAIGLALLVAANPQIRDPDLVRIGDHVMIPVLVDIGTLGGPTA